MIGIVIVLVVLIITMAIILTSVVLKGLSREDEESWVSCENDEPNLRR